MSKKSLTSLNTYIAETIKNRCVEAAKEGFRDALMRGLCTEGAIEAAIGAMQTLDLDNIVQECKRDQQ